MKGKSKHFINAKRKDLSAQQAAFKTNVNISSECLQASYAISLHVVKCKTPHTAVEEFMVLYAIENASIVFNDKTELQITATPCFDNIVQRTCRNGSRCD
jgi:hypothetical protein